MGELWRRFKVGDKVIPKRMGPGENYFWPTTGRHEMAFTPEMNAYAGEVYEVTQVLEEKYGYIYRLSNRNHWAWTDEFLESAAPPSNNREALKLLEKEY